MTGFKERFKVRSFLASKHVLKNKFNKAKPFTEISSQIFFCVTKTSWTFMTFHCSVFGDYAN